MKNQKRHVFKKFETDLNEALRKDRKFKRTFELETAKLKTADKPKSH